MNIGAHVSAAGDVALAPQRAKDIDCECFQFFSRSPQGGKANPITPEIAQKFQTNMKKYGQEACYIHAPYYINFASLNNRIYYGSINVIRDELERGSLLGVKSLMFHPGSYKEAGPKKGLELVCDGLDKVLDGYNGSTELLLEMSAGAGNVIGDTYEEIDKIINSKKLKKYNLGLCFDTAHAFASGYDLSAPKAVAKTFSEFDKILGYKKLKLIHANDSKVELNAKKDRHEHIGQGYIGLIGFKAIVDLAKKHNIDLILETPDLEGRKKDIKVLKSLRDKK
ncbi:MAG: deoxyribonuclease IV [Candidatus Buchananbacteria bacterium]|nr:deoxyribonuclease IV [Candidatus Buchananbacteria bacterium]